jgi:hypothetical protein
LSLNGCSGVTDAGVAQLKGLARLRDISLHYTKVSDAGEKTSTGALPGLTVYR